MADALDLGVGEQVIPEEEFADVYAGAGRHVVEFAKRGIDAGDDSREVAGDGCWRDVGVGGDGDGCRVGVDVEGY